jgi:Ca2+-binding RTX toxin-like protein
MTLVNAADAAYNSDAVSIASALPGWSPLTDSQLGLSLGSNESFANGIYTDNGASVLLESATIDGANTLLVSFRGSATAQDWIDDFKNINDHYTNFSNIAAAIRAISSQYDQVVVTGHSLGGSMAQMFMEETSGDKYLAMTFGAPGTVQKKAASDSRIVNFINAQDPAPEFGANRAKFGSDLRVLPHNMQIFAATTLADTINQNINGQSITDQQMLDTFKYITKNYSELGTIDVLGSGSRVVYKGLASYNPDWSQHDTSAYITNLSSLDSSTISSLKGTKSADVLIGNLLDNSLNGGAGKDMMVGGAGNDTYYVNNVGDRCLEFLGAGQGTDKVISSVTYTLPFAIEKLDLTGKSAINATGNSLDNTITGNAANNKIFGLDGNDRLNGGLGKDILTGNGGNDTFVFDTALGKSNIDIIVDFSSGDHIELDHNIFSKLSAGVDVTSNFHLGTKAESTTDYIIYDAATGSLFYDADGTGTGKAIQFATLIGLPNLAASELQIV